ncbi:MAG: hypothetical protein C4523_03310 [Myxococcales bacterium]|nr:MAG: hypothetical protein C4523_03310 [Myxococcales bacterium]
MNFDPTPLQNEMQAKAAEAFRRREATAFARLETAQPPELKALTLDLLKPLVQAGYWTLALGDYGEENALALALMEMETARASFSLAIALQKTRLFARTVKKYANADVKSVILDPIMRGEALAAVTLLDAARSPLALSASRSGGGFLLNGETSFVVNAPVADWLAVETSVEDKPFILLIKANDVSVVIGERTESAGVNGVAFAKMRFNATPVSASRALGPFDGSRLIDSLAATNDLGLAVAAAGLMKSVFEAIKTYAGEAGATGKPRMADQHVRYTIAELLALVQTAELLALRAIWLRAVKDPEAHTIGRAAKAFCADTAAAVAREALQIAGADGFAGGSLFARALRDAQYIGIAGTDTAAAKERIAKDLLIRYEV